MQKVMRETFKLVEENNRMLRKMRRIQKRNDFLNLFKWMIILAVGVGSFYFLQPYIDLVKQTIQHTGQTLNEIKGFISN